MIRAETSWRTSSVQDVRELAAHEPGKACPDATSVLERGCFSTSTTLTAPSRTEQSLSSATILSPSLEDDAARSAGFGVADNVLTGHAAQQSTPGATSPKAAGDSAVTAPYSASQPALTQPRLLNRLYLQLNSRGHNNAGWRMLSTGAGSHPSCVLPCDSYAGASNFSDPFQAHFCSAASSGVDNADAIPRRLMPVNLRVCGSRTSTSCSCSRVDTGTGSTSTTASCPPATDVSLHTRRSETVSTAAAPSSGDAVMDACPAEPSLGATCLCNDSGDGDCECSMSLAAEEELQPQLLPAPEPPGSLSPASLLGRLSLPGVKLLSPIGSSARGGLLCGNAGGGTDGGGIAEEAAVGLATMDGANRAHGSPPVAHRKAAAAAALTATTSAAAAFGGAASAHPSDALSIPANAAAVPEGSQSTEAAAAAAAAAGTNSHSSGPAVPLAACASPSQPPKCAVQQASPSSSCRVSMKLRSSHVEDLRPGALMPLVRLLVPYGWVMTGLAVRPGCIELVLDYARVGGVSGDEAGGSSGGGSAIVLTAASGHPSHDPNASAGVFVSSTVVHDGDAAGGTVVASAFPDQAVAHLVSCLYQEGLVDPAVEPRVAVQVGELMRAVHWQATAAAPDGSHGAWQCSYGGPRTAAEGSAATVAGTVGLRVASSSLAPIVEPACIVVRPATAASGDAGNGGSSSSNAGAMPDDLLLCVGVARVGALACSVRCMGRFLHAQERGRFAARELLRGGGLHVLLDSFYGSRGREPAPEPVGRALDVFSAPAALSTAAAAAAASVGAEGEVLVVGIPASQLPPRSALLQVELRWRALCMNDATAAAGASEMAPAAVMHLKTPQQPQPQHQVEQSPPPSSQPVTADGCHFLSAATPVLLLRTCSNCFACKSAAGNNSSSHDSHRDRTHIRNHAPAILLTDTVPGAAAAYAGDTCPVCCGVWASELVEVVAQELADLRARMAVVGTTMVEESSFPGAVPVAATAAGVVADAAAIGDPAARAVMSEFLFDLGLLLDAAGCVEEAAASLEQVHVEGAAYHGGGGVGGSVSYCNNQPCRSGDAGLAHGYPSFSAEMHGAFLEQLGLQRTADGNSEVCDDVAGGQSTLQFRWHLADTAATVLAGCGQLSLPYTARLVTSLVASPLESSSVSAAATESSRRRPVGLGLCDELTLVRAAADGDVDMEAWLLQMLQQPLPLSPPQQPLQQQDEEEAQPPTSPYGSGRSGSGGATAACHVVGESEAAVIAAAAALSTPLKSSVVVPMEVEAEAAAPVKVLDDGNLKELTAVAQSEEPWVERQAARTKPDRQLEAAEVPALGQALLAARACAWMGLGKQMLQDFCREVATCFTGYSSPAMEHSFWVDTAARMQAICRLYALMTLAFVTLSAARAYIEDGAAAAAFMVLYQGGQAALLAGFGLWGEGRPSRLFSAVVAITCLRCGCHVALVRGLAPLPSFVLPVCRAWGDVFNEGGAKAVFEQLPTWPFMVLLAGLELPTAYMLYAFMDTGSQGESGLLTRNIPARLTALACLKVAVTVGTQALRRSRFRKRIGAGKVG